MNLNTHGYPTLSEIHHQLTRLLEKIWRKKIDHPTFGFNTVVQYVQGKLVSFIIDVGDGNNRTLGNMTISVGIADGSEEKGDKFYVRKHVEGEQTCAIFDSVPICIESAAVVIFEEFYSIYTSLINPYTHEYCNKGYAIVTVGNARYVVRPTVSEDGIFISPEALKKFSFKPFQPLNHKTSDMNTANVLFSDVPVGEAFYDQAGHRFTKIGANKASNVLGATVNVLSSYSVMVKYLDGKPENKTPRVMPDRSVGETDCVRQANLKKILDRSDSFKPKTPIDRNPLHFADIPVGKAFYGLTGTRYIKESATTAAMVNKTVVQVPSYYPVTVEEKDIVTEKKHFGVSMSSENSQTNDRPIRAMPDRSRGEDDSLAANRCLISKEKLQELNKWFYGEHDDQNKTIPLETPLPTYKLERREVLFSDVAVGENFYDVSDNLYCKINEIMAKDIGGTVIPVLSKQRVVVYNTQPNAEPSSFLARQKMLQETCVFKHNNTDNVRVDFLEGIQNYINQTKSSAQAIKSMAASMKKPEQKPDDNYGRSVNRFSTEIKPETVEQAENPKEWQFTQTVKVTIVNDITPVADRLTALFGVVPIGVYFTTDVILGKVFKKTSTKGAVVLDEKEAERFAKPAQYQNFANIEVKPESISVKQASNGFDPDNIRPGQLVAVFRHAELDADPATLAFCDVEIHEHFVLSEESKDTYKKVSDTKAILLPANTKESETKSEESISIVDVNGATEINVHGDVEHTPYPVRMLFGNASVGMRFTFLGTDNMLYEKVSATQAKSLYRFTLVDVGNVSTNNLERAPKEEPTTTQVKTTFSEIDISCSFIYEGVQYDKISNERATRHGVFETDEITFPEETEVFELCGPTPVTKPVKPDVPMRVVSFWQVFIGQTFYFQNCAMVKCDADSADYERAHSKHGQFRFAPHEKVEVVQHFLFLTVVASMTNKEQVKSPEVIDSNVISKKLATLIDGCKDREKVFINRWAEQLLKIAGDKQPEIPKPFNQLAIGDEFYIAGIPQALVKISSIAASVNDVINARSRGTFTPVPTLMVYRHKPV
jgi:hypothetical protein